jgi:hypothetical protein
LNPIQEKDEMKPLAKGKEFKTSKCPHQKTENLSLPGSTHHLR